MSTDYNIYCENCRVVMHCGQQSGVTLSFGYSSKDLDGRNAVGQFIQSHVCHGPLQIDILDVVGGHLADDFAEVEHEDAKAHDEVMCFRCCWPTPGGLNAVQECECGIHEAAPRTKWYALDPSIDGATPRPTTQGDQ